MANLKVALILFQFLAFFVFIYQMKFSIIKYMEMPVSQSVSSVGFDQIKEPFVYVCEYGQFNHSLSMKYGYKDFFEFMLGSVEGHDNASWSGKQ